jgi:hypothetical protein
MISSVSSQDLTLLPLDNYMRGIDPEPERFCQVLYFSGICRLYPDLPKIYVNNLRAGAEYIRFIQPG